MPVWVKLQDTTAQNDALPMLALHFTVHPNMDRRSVLLFLGHRTPRASLGRVPCVNKTHLTTGPGSDLRRGRTGRAGNTAVRAADAELRAARLRADGVNASTRSSPGRRGSHTAGPHALQWCVEHVALGREIRPSAGRQRESVGNHIYHEARSRGRGRLLRPRHGYPPPPVVSAAA